MMKFKLFDYKVTDEREKALNNKISAECYYIMIAEAVACLVYSSFFNKGVITSNYLYHLCFLCLLGELGSHSTGKI